MKFTYFLFLIALYHSYGQQSDFLGINFKKADSVALSHKGASLQNLPLLTFNLTNSFATEAEKFRAIYTWVCTNVENDYSAYLKTSSKRKKMSKDREGFLKWNQSFTPTMFKKLLKTKKTACTGYAYLIKEMANLVGIKSEIIDGYGRTPTLTLNTDSNANHSWNAVQLSNKWYLCDATWSAGLTVFENNIPKFRSEYTDGYFLADPKLFVKNHYPLKTKWALLEAIPSFTEFLEGPVIYKEAFCAKITPTVPHQMHLTALKNTAITFEINAPAIRSKQQLSLLIIHNGITKTIQPQIIVKEKTYALKHHFEKAGSFDVHLQYNTHIIATYVVKVKRK